MIEILREVGLIIGAIAPFFIKNYFDSRNRKKEGKIINNGIREIRINLDTLKEDFTTFKADSEFRSKLKSIIRIQAANIINYSKGVNDKYKNILLRFADVLEDLAIRYYYSPYRGNETKMSNYLNVEFNGLLVNIKAYISYTANEGKRFKYTNGREEIIRYSDYAIKDISKKTNTLKQKLIDNGLNQDLFLELFEKHTQLIFDEFMERSIEWQNMEYETIKD